MTALERPFASRIAKILNRASLSVADAVEQAGQTANLSIALTGFEDELLRAYLPHYRTTVNLFGRRLLNAAKSMRGYQTKAEDLFAETMEDWIQQQAARNVQKVSDTTIKTIRSAIETGFADSLTGSQVAKLIVEKTGGEIAKYRSRVIARTETHMAANVAGREAVLSTGLQVKRVWISSDDERTRESHSAAHSASHENPVGMDEPFPVVNLMMPGDPDGDPGEVINCRCAVGYHPAK